MSPPVSQTVRAVDAPAAAPEPRGRIAVARPLLPVAAHIAPYLERIDGARWYSNFGPLVTELEQRLSDRHGGASVATVVNATQGLTLALKAMAPTPGLCLVPGFTFVATAHAAIAAGHTPYLLDVDPGSWMLTPDRVADAIRRLNGAVSAVIVVAPFGHMPDVAGFAELEAKSGVPIILDAAAAFDSLGEPKLTSVVSLHATKVLGMGEGGYVVGPSDEVIRRIHVTTSFGFAGTRQSLWPATNAKVSEYAAAVGLAALDGWAATRMRWMLAGTRLRVAAFNAPVAFQDGFSETWASSTCVVKTSEGAAGALRRRLTEANIETRDWWGAGLHREPAFEGCLKDPLPGVEMLAASTIGLPFTVDLNDEDVRAIAAALGR